MNQYQGYLSVGFQIDRELLIGHGTGVTRYWLNSIIKRVGGTSLQEREIETGVLSGCRKQQEQG